MAASHPISHSMLLPQSQPQQQQLLCLPQLWLHSRSPQQEAGDQRRADISGDTAPRSALPVLPSHQLQGNKTPSRLIVCATVYTAAKESPLHSAHDLHL